MDETVFELVESAVKELAAELGYESLGHPSAATPLFSGADGIDSLALVQIVAALERAAERRFGKRVVLADERAMSRRTSPFRTVGTLAELLQERLAE